MQIDINCDVGEGIANEHLLMPYISSCNIACGGHFGDANSIDKTLEFAIKNDVKIGAHPSFPDTENFGRKRLYLSDEELKKSLEAQMDLFLERLHLAGGNLHHVKPHGALYNAIAIDEKLAISFVKIIKKYLEFCFLYVPYNSVIERVALQENIKIKYEAFADRNYNDDLTLVSRDQKNALITNKEDVFHHTYFMLKNSKVKSILGNTISMKADTFCVHGDTENAHEIVRFLYTELQNKGVKIA